MDGGLLALVGRPNVGKSSLFNRIVGGRRALVGDMPGVTRDRIEGVADWRGRTFRVLDTGGIGLDAEADLVEAVALQVSVAVEAAGMVVLVTDARSGVQPLDEEIAATLRKRGRPFVVAANKCDKPSESAAGAADFTRLGAPVFPVSAEAGFGVDDLLDRVREGLPEVVAEADSVVRLALAGRPNAGKSTLLNRLLGEERAVVAERPGTTRDPVEGRLETPAGAFALVDTAGLRRRSKVAPGIERAASARSVAEITAADVVLLLIDPAEGVTAEDRRIVNLIDRRGAGLVVGINKWDLVEGEGTFAKMEASVRRKGGLFTHAPILALSGLAGRGVDRLLAEAAAVAARRRARIPTAALNRLFADRPLEAPGGIRVKYATQVAAAPPAFALFVGGPRLPDGFLRAVESRLRAELDLAGAPVRLVVRRPERRGRSGRGGGRRKRS